MAPSQHVPSAYLVEYHGRNVLCIQTPFMDPKIFNHVLHYLFRTTPASIDAARIQVQFYSDKDRIALYLFDKADLLPDKNSASTKFLQHILSQLLMEQLIEEVSGILADDKLSERTQMTLY